MNSFDKDNAAGILDDCDPPFLSLYMPTHRRHPENQQDPLRFANLVKTLEKSLLQQFPKDQVRSLLEPFVALESDRNFWNHTSIGLAVLGAKGVFRVYKLQRPVDELAVVANSFHRKPLMRIFQSADRFHILGVNRSEVKLYEGNRDAVVEIELAPGIPRTLTDALGKELTEPHLTVASYGGVGVGHSPAHHGHGDRDTEMDKDTERFFRAVDKAVLEHHSQPTGFPLILAALPMHQHLFHEVSHNPFLTEESIDVHPDALSSFDELRDRAWQLVAPRYLARLAELVEQFGNAKSDGRGDDDLSQVAKAVVAGRVGTLLIEAHREIPGRIDSITGDIQSEELNHPEVDDVLDDLATLAMKMGGEVVIVPTERMPTKSGIAAIYRY